MRISLREITKEDEVTHGGATYGPTIILSQSRISGSG